MKIEKKEYRTIWFENNTVKIIDQTKLPHQFIIKELKTVKDAINAIKTMEVRGAPLIGGTAAYGIVLAILENNDLEFIKKSSEELIKSRPTAINLQWAVHRMNNKLSMINSKDLFDVALKEAKEICDEDVGFCESIGINGKMSEFNAALGIVQLRYIDKVLEERECIYQRYTANLRNQQGIQLITFENIKKYNYSYMPILITKDSKRQRDEVYSELKQVNIFTRRYFYPLISEFPYYTQMAKKCRSPNASAASLSILCLPIYPGLQLIEVDYISEQIIGLCSK